MHGYLDTLAKPTARVVGTHLADLNLESASLVFDVAVDNPYSVPLPLANADYALASGGKPFLTGNAPVQGSVPANASMTLSLPARLDFARLLSALEGVKPGGVVPYDASLTLAVDAPVVGRLALPLKTSGQLPVPIAPGIELVAVQWRGLDLSHAEAVLQLRVSNPNQFALELSRLSLGLSLAGHSIASTAVDKPATIAPAAEGIVEIPIGFSPKDLGFSAFQILQGKGSDYHITGLIGANTPFGPLNLPYEKSGSTSFQSRGAN